MAEDNLLNHLRITIGTQKQNELLLNMIKSFLSKTTVEKNELVHGV